MYIRAGGQRQCDDPCDPFPRWFASTTVVHQRQRQLALLAVRLLLRRRLAVGWRGHRQQQPRQPRQNDCHEGGGERTEGNLDRWHCEVWSVSQELEVEGEVDPGG